MPSCKKHTLQEADIFHTGLKDRQELKGHGHMHFHSVRVRGGGGGVNKTFASWGEANPQIERAIIFSPVFVWPCPKPSISDRG